MNENALGTALADIFDPAQRADPYPSYRRWRESVPVARITDDLFVTTSHAACAQVLRDPAFGHPDTEKDRSFIGLDPPDHTRLRRLVSPAFTAHAVVNLRSRIEELTTELVDKAVLVGRVDLMTALAIPLPLTIICELLGVPIADRQQFAGWSDALASSAGPREVRSAAVIAADTRARREFTIYFRRLAAQRRQHGGDDLLSTLAAASGPGGALTEREMLATLTLLLVAGHETTANLIGNATRIMLLDPEQFDALAEDPEVTSAVVDEVLRFDSPVQAAARVARGDTSIDEIDVPAGATVITAIGAANRDPAVHPEPDTFDPRRKDSGQHLSFGRGIHFCLGAHLAKLQGRVVLRELARRTRRPQLAGEPTWRTESAVMRGLSDLPVKF